MRIEFSKKTIAPGVAELRIVMGRPLKDEPDFALTDAAASRKIALAVLAMAGGVLQSLGRHTLSEALGNVFMRVKELPESHWERSATGGARLRGKA